MWVPGGEWFNYKLIYMDYIIDKESDEDQLSSLDKIEKSISIIYFTIDDKGSPCKGEGKFELFH